MAPPKIPLPTDDDLDPEHREMLASLPPLRHQVPT